MQGTRRLSAALQPSQEALFPNKVSCNRSASNQGARHGESQRGISPVPFLPNGFGPRDQTPQVSPSTGTGIRPVRCRRELERISHLDPLKPVSPFVVDRVQHHLMTRQRIATALPRHRSIRPPVPAGDSSTSTWAPLPHYGIFGVRDQRWVRIRKSGDCYATPLHPAMLIEWPIVHFSHPADPGRAPVTTPAAIVVPALFMLVADKLTWLSGVNPRTLVVWPGFRHGIVSAADDVGDDFRGQNVQAPPYPSTLAVHRLASPIGSARHSRLRLLVNLPVRAFAPLIVELFAASDLRSTPGLVITRFPASWRWKLPTPAHVERSSRLLACERRQAGTRKRTPWVD